MNITLVFVAVIGSSLACGAEERPKVTIYRSSDSHTDYYMRNRKITVYCDERAIAQMPKNSYFTTYLSVGRHTFRDKNDTIRKVRPLELTAEPGAEYFVRAEWVIDGGGLFVVKARPHLGLTGPVIFDPFFQQFKPVRGSLPLTSLKPPVWVAGTLVDIERVVHPVSGTETDEEWIYTFKGDRYTFVASERTHRRVGFTHLGIAVGEAIKYSAVSDSVVIQDASGHERPLQLIKKITDTTSEK